MQEFFCGFVGVLLSCASHECCYFHFFNKSMGSVLGDCLTKVKKKSDRSPDPAQGGNIDAQVGGNVLQGNPLKDIRVFFHKELVPF